MALIGHKGHFTDGKILSIAAGTKYLESGKQIHRLGHQDQGSVQVNGGECIYTVIYIR